MSKSANLTFLALLMILPALTALPVTAVANTIHVPGDYPTIQEGIDAAVDGDTVLVASGTYTGPGNKNLDFQGKAITVRSADGPEICIIDCEGAGRGFNFHSGETADAVVDGFTIVNGLAWDGGGIHCNQSSPTISNCIVAGNAVHREGGGIWCGFHSAPTIVGCTVAGNVADDGGGIRCRDFSEPLIVNCLISGNTGIAGGGIAFSDSNATMINCTITNNTADSGAVHCNASDLLIVNCVIWGNWPEQIHVHSGDPVVTYCNVAGGWPGDGNIDADPLFADPAAGDYRLSPGSPCIDAGNNDAVPPEITTDLDGNPRFVDDPATDDTGQGTPPIVDMGAYEFQVDIPGDLNGDGCVDQRDLGILLAYFGWGDGGDCDGDDDTDQSDLGILLAHWGEGRP